MPLSSVMNHVKSVLDGLVFPVGLTLDGTNQVPNLKALIAIESGLTFSAQPLAFIWGGVLDIKRRTMGGPRSASINTTSPFRNITYKMQVTVRYSVPSSLSNIDSIFPLIIDSIVMQLSGTQMPIVITDAMTGWQSTISEIGESFDISVPNAFTHADQRWRAYGARIVTTIREDYQQ
jgi:hypothetical protein